MIGERGSQWQRLKRGCHFRAPLEGGGVRWGL